MFQSTETNPLFSIRFSILFSNSSLVSWLLLSRGVPRKQLMCRMLSKIHSYRFELKLKVTRLYKGTQLIKQVQNDVARTSKHLLSFRRVSLSFDTVSKNQYRYYFIERILYYWPEMSKRDAWPLSGIFMGLGFPMSACSQNFSQFCPTFVLFVASRTVSKLSSHTLGLESLQIRSLFRDLLLPSKSPIPKSFMNHGRQDQLLQLPETIDNSRSILVTSTAVKAWLVQFLPKV